MPGEVVSVQVGQCGNEIGHEYWKKLCEEHCIDIDGSAIHNRSYSDDNCSSFFSSDDSGRYIPRAVLIDLEPRVTSSIANGEYQHLYNKERVFESIDGGGAGNSWAIGYRSVEKDQIGERVMDMIRNELELCDRCDSIMLTHSIAGGTGSGLGSWILENISDNFGRRLGVGTFSVFPSDKSEIVVQPYNSVLTISRLIDYVDLTVILDNVAMNKVAMDKMKISYPSMKDTNSIIARIMAGITSPIRFGSTSYGSFSSIACHLTPVHPLHFVQCGVAPTTPSNSVLQRTSPKDLAMILDKPSSIMSTTFQDRKIGQTDCLLSGLAMFQGDVDPREVVDATYSINSKYSYGSSLIPYSDIDYCISYPQAPQRSALLAVNHSLFYKKLEIIAKQCDKMIKKQVYLKSFVSEDMDEEEVVNTIYQAKDKVTELMKGYAEPWQFCSEIRGDAEN